MSVYGIEQVGRVLGARYRLDAPLGSGAAGAVYRAEDVQLRRTVAVKVVHAGLADDPAFVRRFVHEAQAAAALRHPNLAAVSDWGEDESGRPFLVSEYLTGGSLRDMLDRGRRLTPSQALVIGLEAARGLDHAHRRGLVHRDVKPDNLLFGDDGHVRIGDLGIARVVAEVTWSEPAGVGLDTARYASPEQARGRPVDAKTDVYSLALTLVEAVTGSVPFTGDTTVATLMARLDRLMPVSAELGPLASVVERAGRPDPHERPDAFALGRDLVGAAGRLPRPEPLPLVRADPAGAPPGAGRSAPPTRPARPASTPAAAGSPTVERLATGPPSRRAAASPGEEPVGREDDVDDEAPPPSRRRRAWIALATLVVVAAVVAGAFVYQRSQSTATVAAVVGRTEGEARNILETAGFEVASALEAREGTAAGAVLAQDPPEGTELDEGGTITLVVSVGAGLKAVPELVGLGLADVQTQLGALGLVANPVASEPSEDVPPDAVIRWSVAGAPLKAGTEVTAGTPVDLVVSSGPLPRPVPDVRSVTYDEAAAQLADPAVRLVAQRGPDQFSRDVPAGLVIGTEPGWGTEVARDSAVTIVVSLGPDYVVVPDLATLALPAATAALAEQGLELGSVTGPSDGTVSSSDPGALVQAVRGDTVDVVLVAPPPPPPPPTPVVDPAVDPALDPTATTLPPA